MKQFLTTLAFVILFFGAYAQTPVAIIPEPVDVKLQPGAFELTSKTTLYHDAAAREIAVYLQSVLSRGGQVALARQKQQNQVALLLVDALPETNSHPEGYTLNVTAKGIEVKAIDAAGLFYGVQTLLQLLPVDAGISSQAKVSIPAVQITDYPRFGYRGLMLDVSRHFFGVDEVKKFIDLMARYKFNRFHWHLTDDQGWRVEIKKYPKLTDVGAWRVPRTGYWWRREQPRPGEKASYGGFYTQEEIKAVVRYARDRHIEILPEIDVPGHSMAALAAYPELSGIEGTFQVNPGSTFYRVIDNTLCPCQESTYTFLENVFTEIAALFPYEYIHIGGDECYKGFWKDQASCKQLMASEKLGSLEEVQSYFIKRMEKILLRHGKHLVGWDEILEGGLAPEATVMSWRGMEGGIAAAKAGHKVIMTPTQHCYLDFYQGDPEAEPPTYANLRLKDVYGFEPVPAGVDASLILGGQGNAWTEFMPHYRHVEYMVWPRAFALSEVLWSPKQKQQWATFVPRVETHLRHFDAQGINHSRSFYDPAFTFTRNEQGKPMITLQTEISDLQLYYTTDNTFPDNNGTLYTQPFMLPDGANNVIVISYRNGKPVGKMIRITTEEILGRLGGKKLGY